MRHVRHAEYIPTVVRALYRLAWARRRLMRLVRTASCSAAGWFASHSSPRATETKTRRLLSSVRCLDRLRIRRPARRTEQLEDGGRIPLVLGQDSGVPVGVPGHVPRDVHGRQQLAPGKGVGRQAGRLCQQVADGIE